MEAKLKDARFCPCLLDLFDVNLLFNDKLLHSLQYVVFTVSEDHVPGAPLTVGELVRVDKPGRLLVIQVEVSDLDLDGDEIADYNILLKGALYIDNGESLDDLLAILELLRVIIESHDPSHVGGETTVLLKRDIIVPLFEVLGSLIINIGELHEVIVAIIPHALHEILREGYDGVSCFSRQTLEAASFFIILVHLLCNLENSINQVGCFAKDELEVLLKAIIFKLIQSEHIGKDYAECGHVKIFTEISSLELYRDKLLSRIISHNCS